MNKGLYALRSFPHFSSSFTDLLLLTHSFTPNPPRPITLAFNGYADIDIILEWKPLNNKGNGFLVVILYYLFGIYVETNKDHPNEKNKSYLFRALSSKKSATITCLW